MILWFLVSVVGSPNSLLTILSKISISLARISCALCLARWTIFLLIKIKSAFLDLMSSAISIPSCSSVCFLISSAIHFLASSSKYSSFFIIICFSSARHLVACFQFPGRDFGSFCSDFIFSCFSGAFWVPFRCSL